jgi:hypothetical protein
MARIQMFLGPPGPLRRELQNLNVVSGLDSRFKLSLTEGARDVLPVVSLNTTSSNLPRWLRLCQRVAPGRCVRLPESHRECVITPGLPVQPRT